VYVDQVRLSGIYYIRIGMFWCTDSVQKSLERKFAKRGGTIPVTPSEHFEQRIAVSDLCLSVHAQ